MVEATSSESSDEVVGEGVVGASMVSTTVCSDWSGVGTSMVSKTMGGGWSGVGASSFKKSNNNVGHWVYILANVKNKKRWKRKSNRNDTKKNLYISLLVISMIPSHNVEQVVWGKINKLPSSRKENITINWNEGLQKEEINDKLESRGVNSG